MNYISTRSDNNYSVSPSSAILKGIADDGGLFVPECFPSVKSLEKLAELDYKQLAFEILSLYLSDFPSDALKDCINKAYNEKFNCESIANIVSVGADNFLELYHGQTHAFKDFALSILPHLMNTAKTLNSFDKKTVILTATSGDTGTAALAGFANVPDTSIIVFYPVSGVSLVQKLQMITQEGSNTLVVGVDGNFDDAQTEVKKIFADKTLNKKLEQNGYVFSSANSINIGRLVPQIVYYFFSYFQLVKKGVIKLGEKINFTVPTGNFGNILAAYYAYKSGLPINKLICASNTNNVLSDFFSTGVYNKNREFHITTSPSMDILVSSNLERLLYDVSGCSTKSIMDDLFTKGSYNFNISSEMFESGFATDAESAAAIKEVYDANNYVIDTHTAVAYSVYKKYVSVTNDKTTNIIVSTASPFKFAKDVLSAIDSKQNCQDYEALQVLSTLSSISVPSSLCGLDKKEILHSKACNKGELANAIVEFLNIDCTIEH